MTSKRRQIYYKINKIQKYIGQISKEKKLIAFFVFLFFVVISRLFYLQIIRADHYQQVANYQHMRHSLLEADRGNIFLTDTAGEKQQLTENISTYTMYIDPKFIPDKDKFIDLITPIIYQHLCVNHELEYDVGPKSCIQNLENFTKKSILPDEFDKYNFYLSGKDTNIDIDRSGNALEKEKEVINNFDRPKAYKYIEDRLSNVVQQGYREHNYLGFFEDNNLLDGLKQANLDYVTIYNHNYVYINPSNIKSQREAIEELTNLLGDYGYTYSLQEISNVTKPQEIRYIELINNINPIVYDRIRDLQNEYYSEHIDGLPVLHGMGITEDSKRYYPYGNFLSHVLGYVDNDGKGFYGIEEYYNDLLEGKDGMVVGSSVPWIGQIGSNEITVQEPIDGADIYLTIDPIVQRELESVLDWYNDWLDTDSMSAIIMDPNTAEVKAMANVPDFDPNFYSKEYNEIKPLEYEDRQIIEKDQYLDIPVMIFTGGELRLANYDERNDPHIQKYLFKNKLGPQVFVDKNVSFPFEPGSVFKAFTMAIGIDSDAIDLDSTYDDEGSVQIGEYTINNVYDECVGENKTFLNAFNFSCNVGMIRIIQRTGRYVFYNYLDKLGFGEKTGIELAGEDGGSIKGIDNFSRSRFFNNSFGQGMLMTPIQLAVGYSAMLNGGYLLEPTVVDKKCIYKEGKDECEVIKNERTVRSRVFRKETSKDVKKMLFDSMENGALEHMKMEDYTLGAKAGTSQIAFRGKYMDGPGWTNGAFIGIVTKENTEYLIVVQARRPRRSQWGTSSAGRVFEEMAKILIDYKGIEK